MRRKDREVTQAGEIVEIMERCEVLRLAFNDEHVPYILPVNFGMEPDGMTLYVHGAAAGTKYALMARDNRVSFEMDCTYGLVLDERGHECTMNYESVIGSGVLDELTGYEEKLHALKCIMAQYHSGDFPFDPSPIPYTRILRLRVEKRTAKRRQKHV